MTDSRANQVVVVGSLNMDLIVHVPRLPQSGETVSGGELMTAPGGKGANQAVAARRLGAQVGFIGRVGADAFGASLSNGLLAEGIDVTHVTRDSGASGVALISVDAQGENQITVAGGANSRLSAVDIRAAQSLIATADVCVAQLEVPRAAVLEAFGLARAAGAVTLLNLSPALPVLDDLLRQTSVCVLNEGELAATTGGEQLGVVERAEALLARGPSVVIVTRGARESLLMKRGSPTIRLAPPNVEVIDTVGAGDAFVGALAAHWPRSDNGDWRALLMRANVAGALTTTRHGAQPALPHVRDVEQWVASYATHRTLNPRHGT